VGRDHGFGSHRHSWHRVLLVQLGGQIFGKRAFTVRTAVISEFSVIPSPAPRIAHATITPVTYEHVDAARVMPTTPPAPPGPDLNVGIPMSHPACDGTGIVVLGNAVTPGRYQADVARLLAANPGASYLRTNKSCPSLRRATEEGNPIYAVYGVAGRTQRGMCSAVRAAGGGAYGKWLDNTIDPSYIIPC
jgi:serine/threonine protein kinase, bacterial